MTRWRRALGAGTCLGGLACSSVDLYPITRDAGPSGGALAMAGGGSSAAGDGGSGGTTSPAGCTTPAPPTGDSRQTLLVGGVNRSYLLHIPPSFDPGRRAPLVVDFHGIGETGESERRSSPYPDALDREGVVMAFPDGLRGPAGTAWNVGPCCVADVDDVAFARALVAHVQTLACIDATRVYAVGVLTGGGMTHYLACHAADLFAGVAPAAFDLLEENVADCLPSRPVTVVSFRSTADPRVPYAGGASSLVPGMPLTFLGAQGTLAKWSAIDGCPGEPSPENAAGCSAYTGCAGGADVMLCTRDDEEQHSDPAITWPILRGHTL
jgi:polyhydroxybutyrate depolymerase